MTMRARFHGVAGLLVLALIGAACAGGSASPPASSHDHHAAGPNMGGMDMGGMDMGGMDMGGDAHHGHGESLPPLASRLAAASAVQRTAAADLLARTRTTLAAFTSEAAAQAAGFVPNDPSKRIIHYRNIANRRDDRELDPEHPEGLVYFRDGSGALRLLGALYTVRPREPAPTPGGDIFFWHTHQPSCGAFLVPAGKCTDTFRMLHVWTAPVAVDPWLQPVRDAFGRG